MKRPCLERGCQALCDAPASRCSAHVARPGTAGRGYGARWQRHARSVLRAWVEEHGFVCPGWGGIAPHPSGDLVVDHDVGVMCRSCNGRKGATVDKQSTGPKGGARIVPGL